MSFDGLRKALNELDAIANSDSLKTEMERIKHQNQELIQKNNRINEEKILLATENSKLLEKAKLKEAEIQRRAEALATDYRKRWLTEEKPAVVAKAVSEEISRYPLTCTTSTRQVIDARAEQRLLEEMREGWNAIFFGISNGFKAANKPVAKARPIFIGKITKPDEPK